MEHGQADALRTGRRRRVLITGAGGQLGSALREAFAADDVVALDHAGWDVTLPAPAGLAVPDLVLHAAGWTDVDGAEDDPQGAAAVNVGGTANVAALGAPLVYFSSDYVFDGRKGRPYVESDAANPQSAYGRSKLHGEAAAGEDAWIVRTSWLFGPTGQELPADDAPAGRGASRGAVSSRTSVAPPPTPATSPQPWRVSSSRERGIWHLAADGECTWAGFAEAIFEEAGIRCRVVPITTADLARPARRPAYSVLRSERPRPPALPHWREGLRACLEAMD